MQKAAGQDLSPNHSGIRRSNRNRVPNPIYKEGIKELKRSFKNGKMRDEDSGFDEEDRESYEGSAKSDHGDWLRCHLEAEDGSQKELLVAIKINKPMDIIRKESFAKARAPITKSKDAEKKMEEELRKQRKKSMIQEPEPQIEQGGMGLYQMILNAAQKALAPNPNPEIVTEEEDQKSSSYYSLERKAKRETKQEREGKLLGVKMVGDQLVFEHSKMKTIQIEMKPEPVRMMVEPATHLSNGTSIQSVREAFEYHKNAVYKSSIFI